MISVSQTVSTSTSTSPPPPSIIPSYPGEVHTDSAIVRWLAPPKLPADVSSVSYELVKDEDLVASAISEEFLLVENLAANTNYEFRVKALTDTGLESQWSQPFSLKTLDEGDELSHFSETISGKFLANFGNSFTDDVLLARLDDLLVQMRRKVLIYVISVSGYSNNILDQLLLHRSRVQVS